MIEAHGTDPVRAAEEALMATLDEGELMARAVEGLAAVADARLAERDGRSVVALVGPGNNGADALYAAARLAEAGYAAAAVHHDTVHDGAREAAEAAGVVLTTEPQVLAEADLVLDGVLGIGARPGLPAWARAWVEAVPETAYVVAVDLPSGQDPAGSVLDPHGVIADETVTFSVAKPVHLLPATEQACGALSVVDIGLEVEAEPVVRRLDHDDVAALWPVPGPGDDKYSRGVVGVVAGGEEYTGAAVLCVTAAAESGAGMVRYVGTPSPEGLVRSAVPEATYGVGRAQAWVVGPGLDAGSTRAKAQLAAARGALAGDEPVVVDAGGLDLLDTGVLQGRAGRVTLLTPHAGECARLLARLTGDDIAREVVEDAPLEHARRLAGASGATVLLKGSTTLVVPPGDAAPVWSQADAPPWLATAGAGDVLAGLLGTLLAGGLSADEAGALGALVHGSAAHRANPGGPVRALAVARALPGTVAALLHR
ncbi:bifunctional ADP-dependent NAD(P)H-hydrate dehydratase/NAD(P)H-hydrate epimerase [Phycicoccus sp. CSK15P-2]|uniref:bifunctional ADP-dependent NAD(P)H-hydrate dehydratase/NAD(P)H-hydrate epimerase n=1 Tax=Phycicoccus sp. CSK15P-2 TaxID=2807627 RepID=UPI00194E3F6B|nr:bifunctional ADP-dependent NAD(P)H-hydrate dehydratase/NAD(P)H-hydrate epimerase [Phycicoccus sp. CSK15P-2]MBM6402759.1 bifunctional ADP-dependent NAD(P)H-hydrate dehydratase/NAD(P)H-hydrate epimerase [Phycicoccus sp. CSK15P-2]